MVSVLILSDYDIAFHLSNDELCNTSELAENSVQPASLDITIGDEFSIIKSTPNGVISFDNPVEYTTIKRSSYLLLPKQFALATTNEYIKLPNNVTAFVEGRSSIGRLGLFIQNAGWVDPGFEGQITLELFNASDWAIDIKAGTRVGQLVFAYTNTPCIKPYVGKYQGQIGATGSALYKDFVWRKD